MSGFQGVKRDALRLLSAQDLQSLSRDGGLELAYLHLHSLANYRRMADKLRMAETDTTAPAAASKE